MPRKIYKRIGIRRDKNLADLSDSKQGLNSLLDTLVDDTGLTFISEDLNVIRNLFAEGMDSGQYRKFIGSRTQKTTPTGSLTDVLPPITYQNKLDKFQFFAGEPRLNGGNGLTAKYYDQENIDINTTNIFSGTPIKTDNFWEVGNFNYTGKITPLANNSNGGIEWNGFFVPVRTGPHNFLYSSTASFTFEFEDVAESGTLTERMRIGTNHVISSDYSGQVAFGATFTSSASGAGNEITLATAGNSVRVGVGMSVSGTNIVKDSKVHNVSTSGVITLRHPDVTEPSGGTPAVTGAISSQPLTFYRNTGVNVSRDYQTPTLIAYKKYRIRYRYFVPRYQGPGGTFIAIDSSGLDRNANMDFKPPTASTNNTLPFRFLYGIDYDFSDDAKGTFPKFLDNSILFGGGTIGSSSNSSNYVKVKSTKKIDIKYIPPTSLSAITKASQSCDLTNGSSVASLGNTSGIEIGNYIFGTNIPENTRVIDIVINQFIVMDKNATGGGNQSVTFIDHRGFVKKVTGSSSTNTLTISNGDTTNLKTDMIVIGTDVAQYTGITTTGSTNTVNIFPEQGLGNRSFYFYESKGLRNDSLIQFCQPSIARCLKVVGTINPPSSTIEVESAPPGIVGYRVRGFQFSDATVGGVEGTRITQVTDPNSNGNVTITLSQPTVNPLLDDEKVSIAVANEGDRTLCCPPVDTSPPFQATEDGLQTTSSYPNLKINSGDIKFDNLTVIKNITVQNVSATDVSSKYLDLNTPIGNFKILCE